MYVRGKREEEEIKGEERRHERDRERIFFIHLRLLCSFLSRGAIPYPSVLKTSKGTVETADRDSMLNKIVWANRIVRFRARLYRCRDPLYNIGR